MPLLPRRNRPEMMDGRNLDPRLLAADLRNLETLNRLFGGREVVRRRAAPLLRELPPGRTATVLDLGSGAGDLCRALADQCRRERRPLRLLSLDAHPQVQAFARERAGACYPEIEYLEADAREVPLEDGAADLALCTLALHHFEEEDAVQVLREMRRVTRRFAVASDLSRGRLAYAAVWLATRFTPNPMTRYDGPASVLRAFTPAELEGLAERGGWTPRALHREAWFRMTLIHRREIA